ncbi:MAG: HAD-IIB family hydrolase [Acidobacteria bacterium]|nr:HAD-IIB family hydrolase [Acidobacteriota bacterium]
MLSPHGLVRGNNLELGRDADTGGQVTYVVELARALAGHPGVANVDLLTRLVDDPAVSTDYANPEEEIAPNAQILRLPFGPRRYVRKELLWPHLDQFVDRILLHIRRRGRRPDVIHSHYADAGEVGRKLSHLLGIPLVHTGHSLGRCKRDRLIAAGRRVTAIDRQFHFARRIAAEESVLAHASLVVTSTRQEIVEQYGLYENFDPRRAVVIPPGTDTTRFSPSHLDRLDRRVSALIDRFLREPERPIVLAISRPDSRKNLRRLIAAFGESATLRERANLVLVVGNRDDVRELDEASRLVYQDLLLDIDRYDLYGTVAIPKHHAQEDVAEFYRLAARRRGVFINPALTEPFGLTIIEAAASGLPVVATNDGGPTDIVENCRNGLLVDPLDTAAIATALEVALSSHEQWRDWSRSGIKGIRTHYTWSAHVERYVKNLQALVRRERKRIRRGRVSLKRDAASPLPLATHALVSDIDNTLIGERQGLELLMSWIAERSDKVAFGVATGRCLESAVAVLARWRVPMPDVLITSVGSEIHYGPDARRDSGWSDHIRHKWRRDAVEEALGAFPGLTLQPADNQREFKLSYDVDPRSMPPIRELTSALRSQNLHARLIYSCNAYLDVLPIRASKGLALRYLAYKWGLPLGSFLVAGDSGNDVEMLLGDTRGVVVGGHSAELKVLEGRDRIYFASGRAALGILEGIAHYEFAGELASQAMVTSKAATTGM